MKPEVNTEGGVTVIKLAGKLDAVSSPGLQESVEAILDEGAERVVFDLGGVPFVASAGLRVFAVVAKRLKGAVAVAGMNPNVREVFQLVGFDRLMPLCETADEAKQKFLETG